jgi:hypothetical protein
MMKMPTWTNQSYWSWKRILIAMVALLVVVSLGRSFLDGSARNALDVGRGGPAKEAPSREETPQRVVEFNGKKVPVGSGPIATLNPGLARPGSAVNVNATGFDKGAQVQVQLTIGKNKPKVMATDRADKYGVVDASFTYPYGAANSGGRQFVTVIQENGQKAARAELISQAGVATAELSEEVGPPGTPLTVDAEGFMPHERIHVFWGRITGAPSAVLRADETGKLQAEPLRVGVGPVGHNTVILMGTKSRATAMAPFQLLRQYPSVLTKPFAARAGELISLTGKGFAPNERVLGYFGEVSGPPVITMRAADNGRIGGVAFKVPYGLKGRQTLVFVGEQSRASAKAGFLAQPYTPVVRTSTWGGLPGTVLNFYAKGFAPNEAVHVYVEDELVAAFRVDARGSAAAAGKYQIPADAQKSVTFKLIGARSGGTGTVTVKVDKPEGPVQIPPQPKFKLPKDLRR